jgi:hypothetical protein
MRITRTSRARRVLSVASGLLLTATLSFAQPPPQTPPVPQDPTPVPDPRTQDLAKPEPKVPQPAPAGRLTPSEAKFTGCLQRGQASTATQGGEGATLAGGYVLAQATTTRAKDAEKGEAGPGGTKEYRLVPKDDSIKLADHVGHQVELKGRITLAQEAPAPTATESGTSSSRPPGSTGVSTTPSAGGPAAAGPPVTLTVTSLKMVAPSCSTPASE